LSHRDLPDFRQIDSYFVASAKNSSIGH